MFGYYDVMNSRPGDSDDFAHDHNGNPLVDRFGRPVRKRSALPRPTDRGPKPPEYRRAENARPSDRSSGGQAYGGHPRHDDPRYSERSAYDRPTYDDPSACRNYDRPGNRSYEIPSRREERLARIGTDAWEGRRRKRTQKPPRRHRKIGILKPLAAVLALLLVLTVGTALWIDTSLNRTDAIAKYDGRVGNTAGTNWLLVGSDSRAGLNPEDAARLTAGDLDDSVGRTDTIMLVHVPSFGGETRIISFPRDSWVNIPGHGENKINQAFTLGGAPLLQRTIEEATGLRIDHYAEIGFGGFAGLVDGVGGIEMCLDEPLQDPMAGIDLQAGCQKMDGPTALGFVRSRYASANGDLDRVERQRKFLSALSAELGSAGTLLNPFRSVPVMKAATETLTVNKSDHVWHLARLAMGIAGGAKQETVPVGGFMDTYAGSAVQWDSAAAEELFASMR